MSLSAVYWIGVLRVFKYVLVLYLIYTVIMNSVLFFKVSDFTLKKKTIIGIIIVALLAIFIPNAEVFYSMLC